ncbi:hypothetical protein F5X71_10570 [Nocardia brasiliensis]|uniref:Uncharacterized protein n=1 Tax=Nocardia brasiliensis TaxID=37326 RepID=A0A6G9XP81_NOCBR|nr:hypothetical protein [Nocardia brasiliensis]QIS02706.1 hypothetical protein F5X71_10570 [Nocardia brasiliensis]
MENETHAERMKRIRREIEDREKKEEAAWHPAKSLERTAWNVLGCWQMLVSQVNFTYFHSAGPGAPPLDKETLPVKIRKAAENFGVRWPHEDWSTAADRPKKVRHKLAHLLYIDSVTGTAPHRTMNIVRMGEPGEPRTTADGHPRGLSWRYVPDPATDPDGAPWSQMTMHLDTITEDELSHALEAMRWMRDCCFILERLGSIAAEIKPRRSLILPQHEQDLLEWWFPDWGERATTTLKWGDILLPETTTPSARNDGS